MGSKHPMLGGILLLIISTLAVAIGQTIWKYAQNSLEGAFFWVSIFIGLGIYGFGAIFMILGLKKGEFSRLHPILSFKYVWVVIIGVILFNEQLGITKGLGIIAILIGVYALVK